MTTEDIILQIFCLWTITCQTFQNILNWLIGQVKAVPGVYHVTFPGADIEPVRVNFEKAHEGEGGIGVAAQRVEIDFSGLSFNYLTLEIKGCQSLIDLSEQDRVIGPVLRQQVNLYVIGEAQDLFREHSYPACNLSLRAQCAEVDQVVPLRKHSP